MTLKVDHREPFKMLPTLYKDICISDTKVTLVSKVSCSFSAGKKHGKKESGEESDDSPSEDMPSSPPAIKGILLFAQNVSRYGQSISD